jgi:hypothetical protein
VKELSHQQNLNEIKWYEHITFDMVKDHENILCGWIAGHQEFESLDDSIIACVCTNLFRDCLNRDDIPEPKAIIR